MTRLNNQKGFTIVEMLIVLSLMTALIGIVMPAYKTMEHAGNEARARGDLRTLQTAVEHYRISEGTLPEELGDVEAVKSIPMDPYSDSSEPEEYKWKLQSKKGHYIIYSVGPDNGNARFDDDEVEADDGVIYVSNLDHGN